MGHVVQAPEEAAAFCAREFPRLVATLDAYLGDRAVAEELAQEALLRTFQRWEKVSQLDKPGAWTRRVALNLANSSLRRRGAERRAMARVAASTEVRDQHSDPDTATTLTVRAALAALPKRPRLALVLHHQLGLPTGEVARELGVSDAYARKILERARASLRAALSEPTPAGGTP